MAATTVARRAGMRIPAWRADIVVAGAAALLLAYLTVVPLAMLLLGAVSASGSALDFQFTTRYLERVVTDQASLELLANSLIYAGGAAALAFALGTAAAWAVERTNIPARSLWYGLALVPLIVPGIVHTVSYRRPDASPPGFRGSGGYRPGLSALRRQRPRPPPAGAPPRRAVRDRHGKGLPAAAPAARSVPIRRARRARALRVSRGRSAVPGPYLREPRPRVFGPLARVAPRAHALELLFHPRGRADEDRGLQQPDPRPRLGDRRRRGHRRDRVDHGPHAASRARRAGLPRIRSDHDPGDRPGDQPHLGVLHDPDPDLRNALDPARGVRDAVPSVRDPRHDLGARADPSRARGGGRRGRRPLVGHVPLHPHPTAPARARGGVDLRVHHLAARARRRCASLLEPERRPGGAHLRPPRLRQLHIDRGAFSLPHHRAGDT